MEIFGEKRPCIGTWIKFFVVLIGILIFTSLNTVVEAQAVTLDEIKAVQFKDGTIIKGKIEQMNVYVIKIRTINGTIVTRKYDDVELFLGENFQTYGKTEAASTYGKTEAASVSRPLVQRFGVGARVGYINFTGDNVTILGYKVDIDPNQNFIFGINLTYFLTDSFSLELSMDHMDKTDTELKASGLGLDAGKFSVTPLMLTARFHIPVKTLISPYIGGGVGYHFNDFHQNAALWGSENLDIKNNFGVHANIGAEIFFTKQKDVALNIDLKYVFTSADVDYNGPVLGIGTKNIRLDSFISSIGIKYFF